MKKSLLFVTLMFISLACFSQDIISLKRGGAKIEGIVTEITPTLVRYKLFSDPNGRVYFAYRDDISSIIHKDGSVETFDSTNNQAVETKNALKEQNQQQKSEPRREPRKVPSPIQKPEPKQKKQILTQTQDRPLRPIVRNKKNVEVKGQPINRLNQSKDVILSDTGGKCVIYLKDGNIISGTILEQVPNQSIKIKTKSGNIFAYQTDEIDRIEKGTLKQDNVEENKATYIKKVKKQLIKR